MVLAPVAIAIAYAGGWLWAALVTLAAIGLYVEWLMIVGAARERRVTARAVSRWPSPDFASHRDGSMPSLVVLALGCRRRGMALAGAARTGARPDFFYAAAAEVASVLVRLDRVQGFVALILILLVVWVTDIGGYFAGRGIGGPKLWPRVSPKKTWAGAVGGFAASLVVAAGFVQASAVGQNRSVAAAWARCSRSFRSLAISSNPR